MSGRWIWRGRSGCASRRGTWRRTGRSRSRLIRSESRRFEVEVAVEGVAEGLEFGAEVADGDGRGDGELRFQHEEWRAGEGGGFLAGGEVFDVDVELAEDGGDAVDEAGLVHGVGL